MATKTIKPFDNGTRVRVKRGEFKTTGFVVGKHHMANGEWYQVNVAPRAEVDIRHYRASNLTRM